MMTLMQKLPRSLEETIIDKHTLRVGKIQIALDFPKIHIQLIIKQRINTWMGTQMNG